MKITFLGAAQGVTGSKHLLEAAGRRILLDCGSFQGHRAAAYQANAVLPPATADLDAVILSHAHADHCGSLPLLVKNGFNKKIYATPATIDIARLIMLDSAKLQKNDYKHLKKRAAPGDQVLPPIYSEADVEKACRLFSAVPYCQDVPAGQNLGPELDFKFYNAGHILGSAVTLVKSGRGAAARAVAYTGDLGSTNVPILPDPENIPEPVDVLISECTYGDRNHRPLGEALNFLKKIINEAVANQSRIIVPAFALGRTQELIYILHKLHDDGEIPALPIYLDSPLAGNITAAFTRHNADFDRQTWQDFISNHESPFVFEKLHYIQTVAESKRLSQKPGPLMIIASSGMLEGGRILYHLENNVGDPRSVIVLTGYQAEYTLGRKLQSGDKTVRIYGRSFAVRAQILSIDEFSAHADQRGLLDYMLALKGLKKLFLVHAEQHPAETFSRLIKTQRPDLEVIIPPLGASFTV
jgi:metallo-beta-lactamase family protein